MSEVELLKGKALETLLNKYFTTHSSRRINFLYWNHIGGKDKTLNFVNLTGKELTRLNNSELLFRSIRVRNSEDWEQLCLFLNTCIVDPLYPKSAYVVRVDFLTSYLKKLKYDPELIRLTRNDFGTALCQEVTAPADVKPICTMDLDIQSLVLVDQIYNKYRKLMFSDKFTENPDCELTDILPAYMSATETGFKFQLGKHVSMPAVDGLDVVARKFITSLIEVDPKTKLEQIFTRNGISTVVSRLTGHDVCIISLRVHLQYFLKQFKQKDLKP